MKPVLVAMNNPQSPLPTHCLYPHPEGCAGHRLWRMLEEAGRLHPDRHYISRKEYLERFERRNLLDSVVWDRSAAQAAAGALRERLRGRVAAILGQATRKALRLRRPGGKRAWFLWDWDPELNLWYVLLPHPSGRCREYNDPAMCEAAGKILLQMYRGKCDT